MKKHCVSLKLSKELNGLLPEKYKSEFYWGKLSGKNYFLTQDSNKLHYGERKTLYRAYLSSELGEILPSNLHHLSKFKHEKITENANIGLWLTIDKNDEGGWVIGYGEDGISYIEIRCEKDKNLANTMCRMLIHLIKSKTIKL